MFEGDHNVVPLRQTGKKGQFERLDNDRPLSPTGLFKTRFITLLFLTIGWCALYPLAGARWAAIPLLFIICAAPLASIKFKSALTFFAVRLCEGVAGMMLVFSLGGGRLEAMSAFVILVASPVDDTLFSLPVYIVLQLGAWIVIPVKALWVSNWEEGTTYVELRDAFFDASTFPGEYLRNLRGGRMREFLAERAKLKLQRYMLPPHRTPAVHKKDGDTST